MSPMRPDPLLALRASLDHLQMLVKAERARRAGLRLDFAYARFTRLRRKYDPDQPRDDHGRWAETGAGDDVDVTGTVTVVRRYRTGNPDIDNVTEILEQKVVQAMEEVGPGAGPTYGTRVHSAFAKAVRAERIPGISVESSFSL